MFKSIEKWVSCVKPQQNHHFALEPLSFKIFQACSKFSSITSLGFKHDSYDLHHHIIIATPHNSYNISRKKVSMEIWGASTIPFCQIWEFFTLKPSAPKGESSLKISIHYCQLIWKEIATNKRTERKKLYDIYCFSE